MERRRRIAAALAVLLPVVASCHRAKGEGEARGGAAPSATSAPPADHLAPGELVEGEEKAFGLVLPREIRVQGRFEDVVYAGGHVVPGALVGYVRARVVDGKATSRSGKTTFDGVRVPGDSKRLFIEVDPLGDGARLTVHDASPPPLPNLPSDEARWREQGLAPNGQPLDPKHQH